MKIPDVMFKDNLTESELKALPSDAVALWLSRPRRNEIDRAKVGMRVRVVLLVAATAYYSYAPAAFAEIASLLLFCMYFYEAAYYQLRKEKTEREYDVRMEGYMTEVKGLSHRFRRGGLES